MYCDELKISVQDCIGRLAICKYNPVTCNEGIRLAEHEYYVHCTTSRSSSIRLPHTPRYGSTTNTQAPQRERMIFCRGGDGEGGGRGRVLGRPRIYVQPEWHDCANRFCRCADLVLVGQWPLQKLHFKGTIYFSNLIRVHRCKIFQRFPQSTQYHHSAQTAIIQQLAN